MLLQNLYVPFSIYGAFTDVQVTHAMYTKTPPMTSQMLAFELCTGNSLDGPSPLWPVGNNVNDFQKQFEMGTRLDHSTLFHFASVHLR